jgi:hypothetical protein
MLYPVDQPHQGRADGAGEAGTWPSPSGRTEQAERTRDERAEGLVERSDWGCRAKRGESDHSRTWQGPGGRKRSGGHPGPVSA